MVWEVRFWEWLWDWLKGIVGLYMWWVENLVSLGDLDVDGCWNGLYFEFELKGCDWFKCGGKFGFEVR